MAGEERLAAARGDAQADVGHLGPEPRRDRREVGHRRAVVGELHFLECLGHWNATRDLVEKLAQRGEHTALVVLEGDHGLVRTEHTEFTEKIERVGLIPTPGAPWVIV